MHIWLSIWAYKGSTDMTLPLGEQVSAAASHRGSALFRWLIALTFLCFASATSMAATTDHSKLKELDKDFKTGPEVTRACLSCHNKAAGQLHKTLHWKWDYKNPKTGQKLGKKNILNAFCVGTPSNEHFCTACHIGYGWKDKNFDFTSEENVDCLACHDTTGEYNKPPGKAGNPGDKVNLKKVAQNVGKTSRDTCGNCHFYGGGGDGVKHGDLDSSLAMPEEKLDVHMDAVGLDFTCATCHLAANHKVSGSRYAPTAAETRGIMIRGKHEQRNPATCRSCHGPRPHPNTNIIGIKLNGHTDELACQTCHIPTFARGGVATKMLWDWSTAGKTTPDGKPLVKKGKDGHPVYNGKKGTFEYGENVVPHYMWFNGTVRYTLPTDKIDPAKKPIPINTFEGSPDDGKSRIWPVKLFHGKQPYDKEYKTLLAFHTAPTGPDDKTAFWKNFNWPKAIEDGMKAAGRPYSGKFDFVETTMLWPITHMVAPARDALKCEACHSTQGRLKGLPGIYMPATGANPWIDRIGLLVVLATLLGVIGHGLIRIFYRKGGNN